MEPTKHPLLSVGWLSAGFFALAAYGVLDALYQQYLGSLTPGGLATRLLLAAGAVACGIHFRKR